MDTIQIANDVNVVSSFISCEDISNLTTAEPVDCIILCVCAVLHSAETVFSVLGRRPDLTKTVVLCGGIGHSTKHIYNAVGHHPKFVSIAEDIKGLPESQVLLRIYNDFYSSRTKENEPRMLVEDRSVTCHTNASEARKLLKSNKMYDLKNVIIVQDPTMVRRTVACFEKVYEDQPNPPRFAGCPIFVPQVEAGKDNQPVYKDPPVEKENMWPMDRFLELVMGEIPRMRDDANGYGPNGNGSIVHVDIPDEVEVAWQRLSKNIEHRRY
ncbi:hypothetical protein BDV96DRAFT_595192 [Lophiotrema nucula]|uniref:Uncharacterized protein n=1 Tax=Lophiotrema nucula TaxID=690887 RepID=A0A6A5ZM94_9PLEO|nr:hypothetical protein BDV96DRAFT_595192 [Lophiotrema nucula]